MLSDVLSASGCPYAFVLQDRHGVRAFFLSAFGGINRIDDSLLLDRTMPDSNVKLQVARFAEESALLIVTSLNDEVTPFNLSPKGSLVNVEKKNGRIFIFEEEN